MFKDTIKNIHKDEFKIGRTSLNVGVKNRLKQWTKQCNGKLKLYSKWHVKNHQICEQMIHEELKLKGFWSGKKKCENLAPYYINKK